MCDIGILRTKMCSNVTQKLYTEGNNYFTEFVGDSFMLVDIIYYYKN